MGKGERIGASPFDLIPAGYYSTIFAQRQPPEFWESGYSMGETSGGILQLCNNDLTIDLYHRQGMSTDAQSAFSMHAVNCCFAVRIAQL